MSSSSRRRADGRAPRLAGLLLAAVLLQAAWAVAAVASAAGQLAVAAVAPSTVDRQVSLVASVSPVPAAAPRSEDFAVSLGDVRVPSAAVPVLSDRLALALVVDGSSAGAPALHGAVSGATNLLLQLPTSVRSATVVDTSPPAVPAPLSEGPTDAVGALSAVRSGGERRTAEALALAVGQLPRDAGTPRLVVLATGATDAGGEPAAELGRRLREARVLLTVVGSGPDQRYWTRVAQETGGLVVDGRRSTPSGAFDAVAAGLRGRYLVTFGLPEQLPTRVTVRLDTGGGPLSASAEVPAPVPASAPAPAAPGGARGGLVGALLLVLALAAGVGVLVGRVRRRARPAAPAPPAPAPPAAAPPSPPAIHLPRRPAAASPVNGIPDTSPPGDRPAPTSGQDQPGGRPPGAVAPPGDQPGRTSAVDRTASAPPAADEPPDDQPGTAAEADLGGEPGGAPSEEEDESAYRRLDAEVGRAAIAVEDGRLDVRRAVARIAMAAPGRPDLLDRVVDTERRIAGARLGASPSTSTVLDLLAAARRVVTGEAALVGPDGVRVEQAGRRLRLTRDGEPVRDFDSVAELARHVDLAALADESSSADRG